MSTKTKPGTIDDPAKTTLPAEHYTDTTGDLPGLVIDIDLTSLGVGTGRKFEFDSILNIDHEDGIVSLLCYPSDDDEGWDRLDEVGEW